MSAQFKSVEPDECDAGRHVRARCHHNHAPRPRRPLRATCARHGRQPPRPKRVPARQRLSWPDRVPSRSPDRARRGLCAQSDAVITSRRMPAPSKRTNAQLGTHGANRRHKPWRGTSSSSSSWIRCVGVARGTCRARTVCAPRSRSRAAHICCVQVLLAWTHTCQTCPRPRGRARSTGRQRAAVVALRVSCTLRC